MSEGDVRWTVHDGERVEVPATIGGIRATLSEDRRARFDAEIDAANVDKLYNAVRRWIVELASFPEDFEPHHVHELVHVRDDRQDPRQGRRPGPP